MDIWIFYVNFLIFVIVYVNKYLKIDCVRRLEKLFGFLMIRNFSDWIFILFCVSVVWLMNIDEVWFLFDFLYKWKGKKYNVDMFVVFLNLEEVCFLIEVEKDCLYIYFLIIILYLV